MAEGIAQRLGYRRISREVLLEAARQYGVPEEKLSRALTQTPGILERLTQEKGAVTSPAFGLCSVKKPKMITWSTTAMPAICC